MSRVFEWPDAHGPRILDYRAGPGQARRLLSCQGVTHLGLHAVPRHRLRPAPGAPIHSLHDPPRQVTEEPENATVLLVEPAFVHRDGQKRCWIFERGFEQPKRGCVLPVAVRSRDASVN